MTRLLPCSTRPILTLLRINGEALRFHVLSRTNLAVRYLVDLESFNFNGECGCEDFEFRHAPVLCRQVKPVPSDRTRCYHIRAARNWILDTRLLPEISHAVKKYV